MKVRIVYSKVTDSWWLTDGKGKFFLECPTEAEAREMAEDWVPSMREIISGRTETGRGIDHDLRCFLWAQKFVPFILEHISDPEEKYHLHYLSMREVRKVNLLDGIKVNSKGNVFLVPGTKMSDIRRAFI